MSVSGYFRRSARVAVATWLVAMLCGVIPTVSASELDVLQAQILRQPDNPQLNLRFAEAAENAGQLRWALSAYERVLLIDPNNPEAQRGIVGIRQKLRPDTTTVTLQLGTQYESNPTYYLRPRSPEMEVFGAASLFDDRYFNGTRWRTNAFAVANVHTRNDELTYGAAGFDTGPVLNAFAGWTFRPAVGASAAYFDHRFYYGEGSLSGTFENDLGPISRALTVRGAYRSYDDHFPSQQGFYVETRARFAMANAFGSDIAVSVSPWVIWSDISGTAPVVTPIITGLQPGTYVEYGGRVDFIRSFGRWLVLDLNVAVSQRDYRNDVVFALQKRKDTIVSPGVIAIFPSLVAAQTDLRLEYRYFDDHSNDATRSFTDHLVSASVITRFDPTVGPAWTQTKR